mmetsp:Transcript_2174/g.7963  ORF Transcript_2174/g.7963 Transcript_2174/m.7963 type:complete len:1693 (-) Transcript_2174:415-5493(-)|eukprot:CAMPEP_0117439578 /NCGR_PEP_ID=MMETSP0759-20121206/2636_1 /TAXON_ID=63605 /ORGANISM="Percolomonas cosmopolitus, Strain WS" /LENGTH=1692 /DNA_ID=CAMNT_0005231295 /DNA_START=562 /DNA_END=5640 /DNA_ORIENTATION=+
MYHHEALSQNSNSPAGSASHAPSGNVNVVKQLIDSTGAGCSRALLTAQPEKAQKRQSLARSNMHWISKFHTNPQKCSYCVLELKRLSTVIKRLRQPPSALFSVRVTVQPVSSGCPERIIVQTSKHPSQNFVTLIDDWFLDNDSVPQSVTIPDESVNRFIRLQMEDTQDGSTTHRIALVSVHLVNESEYMDDDDEYDDDDEHILDVEEDDTMEPDEKYISASQFVKGEQHSEQRSTKGENAATNADKNHSPQQEANEDDDIVSVREIVEVDTVVKDVTTIESSRASQNGGEDVGLQPTTNSMNYNTSKDLQDYINESSITTTSAVMDTSLELELIKEMNERIDQETLQLRKESENLQRGTPDVQSVKSARSQQSRTSTTPADASQSRNHSHTPSNVSTAPTSAHDNASFHYVQKSSPDQPQEQASPPADNNKGIYLDVAAVNRINGSSNSPIRSNRTASPGSSARSRRSHVGSGLTSARTVRSSSRRSKSPSVNIAPQSARAKSLSAEQYHILTRVLKLKKRGHVRVFRVLEQNTLSDLQLEKFCIKCISQDNLHAVLTDRASEYVFASHDDASTGSGGTIPSHGGPLTRSPGVGRRATPDSRRIAGKGKRHQSEQLSKDQIREATLQHILQNRKTREKEGEHLTNLHESSNDAPAPTDVMQVLNSSTRAARSRKRTFSSSNPEKPSQTLSMQPEVFNVQESTQTPTSPTPTDRSFCVTIKNNDRIPASTKANFVIRQPPSSFSSFTVEETRPAKIFSLKDQAPQQSVAQRGTNAFDQYKSNIVNVAEHEAEDEMLPSDAEKHVLYERLKQKLKDQQALQKKLQQLRETSQVDEENQGEEHPKPSALEELTQRLIESRRTGANPTTNSPSRQSGTSTTASTSSHTKNTQRKENGPVIHSAQGPSSRTTPSRGHSSAPSGTSLREKKVLASSNRSPARSPRQPPSRQAPSPKHSRPSRSPRGNSLSNTSLHSHLYGNSIVEEEIVHLDDMSELSLDIEENPIDDHERQFIPPIQTTNHIVTPDVSIHIQPSTPADVVEESIPSNRPPSPRQQAPPSRKMSKSEKPDLMLDEQPLSHHDEALRNAQPAVPQEPKMSHKPVAKEAPKDGSAPSSSLTNASQENEMDPIDTHDRRSTHEASPRQTSVEAPQHEPVFSEPAHEPQKEINQQSAPHSPNSPTLGASQQQPTQKSSVSVVIAQESATTPGALSTPSQSTIPEELSSPHKDLPHAETLTPRSADQSVNSQPTPPSHEAQPKQPTQPLNGDTLERVDTHVDNREPQQAQKLPAQPSPQHVEEPQPNEHPDLSTQHASSLPPQPPTPDAVSPCAYPSKTSGSVQNQSQTNPQQAPFHPNPNSFSPGSNTHSVQQNGTPMASPSLTPNPHNHILTSPDSLDTPLPNNAHARNQMTLPQQTQPAQQAHNIRNTSIVPPEKAKLYGPKRVYFASQRDPRRISTMINGANFIKYHFGKKNQKQAAGSKRQLKLEQTLDSLLISHTGLLKRTHRVPLREIMWIVFGQNTRTLKGRVNTRAPWRCFSIVLKDRSIDLEAPSDEDALTWILGLQSLVYPSIMMNERPLYTKTVLIMKRLQLKLKMQQTANMVSFKDVVIQALMKSSDGGDIDGAHAEHLSVVSDISESRHEPLDDLGDEHLNDAEFTLSESYSVNDEAQYMVRLQIKAPPLPPEPTDPIPPHLLPDNFEI